MLEARVQVLERAQLRERRLVVGVDDHVDAEEPRHDLFDDILELGRVLRRPPAPCAKDQCASGVWNALVLRNQSFKRCL